MEPKIDELLQRLTKGVRIRSHLIDTYISNLIAKFTQTGSIANVKRNQQRVLNEAAQIEVLGHFGKNPNNSLRQISAATEISLGSVHKIKNNKFHPYKIKVG